MVAGLLTEEQVMAPGSLRPIGQCGRVVRIIRQHDSVLRQTPFDGRQFSALVGVGVKAVVQENVNVL